ncbi:alpha-2-macroglobulin [Alphaproteobacteria bacterium]
MKRILWGGIVTIVVLVVYIFFILPYAQYLGHLKARIGQSNRQTLSILRVTPQGDDVHAEHQITIQFNRPVVPLGRMERKSNEIPVKIEPAVKCEWRWVNTSTLACNLGKNEKLKNATSYSVIINPGIKAEDGAIIGRSYHHKFTTLLPAVYYARVHKWLAPGVPVIQMYFNQKVTSESVKRHIYLRLGCTTCERFAAEIKPELQVQDENKKIDLNEPSDTWFISPGRELPLGEEVGIMLNPGLISKEGGVRGLASDNIYKFHTFQRFKFVGIKCYTNNGDAITITNDEESQQFLCDPLNNVMLLFTSGVLPSQAKKNILVTPNMSDNADFELWGQDTPYTLDYNGGSSDRMHSVSLMGLKANQEYRIKTKDNQFDWKEKILAIFDPQRRSVTDLHDQFGRTLDKHIDISFKTDHRKPNIKLSYKNAIIEKQIDSEVPLYVNNIKSVNFHYRKLTANGSAQDLIHDYDTNGPEDVQFAIPMKIRNMLGGKSGAVFGTIWTVPDIKINDTDRLLFAEVTPYQVHVKAGVFNTVVWVTDLATGLPVKDAEVKIYEDKVDALLPPHGTIELAKTDTQGIAVLPGLSGVYGRYRYDYREKLLFVHVSKGEEMALLPLSDDFMLNPYSLMSDSGYFGLKSRGEYVKAWGFAAQGVYRLGDTIQYKVYVRDQDNKTLIPARTEGYGLAIIDPTGKKIHEVTEIHLNEFGAYSGEYTVPDSAAVGWYEFQLTGVGSSSKLSPMRVLVSDFSAAPFNVDNQISGKFFLPEQDVTVLTTAKLHSGGAYADAKVRVTALLQSKAFEKPKGLEDFSFDTYNAALNTESQQVFQKIDKLNSNGEFTTTFKINSKELYYGQLSVESSVQDDRGKNIAIRTDATYASVDRFVGLSTAKKWNFEVGKVADVRYVVTDIKGAPVADTDVDITIEYEDVKGVRVRGAGDAYLTEYKEEWVAISSCKGKSELIPSVCQFTPQKAGSYRVVAKILGTKEKGGVTHSTTLGMYVSGSDYVLWENPLSLDIVPKQDASYKVGDVAEYLVKNPYPGATALITIERYGVIDSFVQVLEGSTPVVKFPIKPEYIPGVYLSVMVMSPRVDKPIKDGVDLGKPAFRIGYTKVEVEDSYKKILVSGHLDSEVYKPRDKVKLSLHAESKAQEKRGRSDPIEVAVVVLDEAVFDLIQGGKNYYNPYPLDFMI